MAPFPGLANEFENEVLSRKMKRFKKDWYDVIERNGLRPYYSFWADFIDVIDGLESIGGEKRG